MLNSEARLLIETVRPDDGRHESFWVALVITGILLLGGLGILARQAQPVTADTQTELDVLQSQFMMELSIAAEEIRFLQTLNSDNNLPELQQLLQDELLPVFPGQSSSDWQQLEPGCLLLEQPVTHQHFALVLQPTGSSIHLLAADTPAPDHCKTLLSLPPMDIQP